MGIKVGRFGAVAHEKGLGAAACIDRCLAAGAAGKAEEGGEEDPKGE